MKQFLNENFIISSNSDYWHKIGFKVKTDDERIVKIKPVHAIKQSDNEWKIQMNAEISFNFLPKVSTDNVVFLMKKESGYLKNALKNYANLISVTDFCKVSISSPTPSSGFIPKNEEELTFLNKTKGFEHGLIVKPNFTGKFFKNVHQDPLLDRLDGVSFLASANSQIEHIGKFRDCMRFFENAFSATTNTLAQLLFEFLSSNDQFDYSLEEITEWMVDTRHGATHADQRSTFIFSSDLGGDIDRILQAAYDVMFNKKI